jgi:glycosyltransferase involved in cell wall biosynthesis
MNIRLDIVGKGLCSEKLKLMSQNDNRIKFHDFLEGKELLKMYVHSNLTVVPSIWYDNSPMVIYESFSYGTPVIGSKIGGIPELIEDGFNGYLFEAGNVNELQQLLETLIDSPETLEKLEQGTYESVQKYTMEKHIEQLEKEYQKLAK